MKYKIEYNIGINLIDQWFVREDHERKTIVIWRDGTRSHLLLYDSNYIDYMSDKKFTAQNSGLFRTKEEAEKFMASLEQQDKEANMMDLAEAINTLNDGKMVECDNFTGVYFKLNSNGTIDAYNKYNNSINQYDIVAIVTYNNFFRNVKNKKFKIYEKPLTFKDIKIGERFKFEGVLHQKTSDVEAVVKFREINRNAVVERV